MSACSTIASFTAILSKEIFDGHDKIVFEAMSAANTKPNKPPRVRY